jgi:hypothetical protein
MRASKAIAGIVVDAGYCQNARLLTAAGAGPVRYYFALVRPPMEAISRQRSPLTKAPHSPGPKTKTGPA